MKKAEKSFFVENLTQELASAKSTFLVDYSGLSVANQRELKKRLKEVNARFLVVKNTLFNLAGKEAKYPAEILTDTVLSGQNALVIADDDPVKPLAAIVKFATEFELPQIKVGVVEGFFQDKEQLTFLAKLGGKEALVSQLIGVLIAPTYNLVTTTQAILQDLVMTIDQISKKTDIKSVSK